MYEIIVEQLNELKEQQEKNPSEVRAEQIQKLTDLLHIYKPKA